jgi:hypothetical protein
MSEMEMVEKRMCYIVQIGQCDENGYIPSVVVEGEAGHSPLTGRSEFSRPWYWGKTYEEAEATCKNMNTEMGLTDHDVTTIVWSSMRMGKPA